MAFVACCMGAFLEQEFLRTKALGLVHDVNGERSRRKMSSTGFPFARLRP